MSDDSFIEQCPQIDAALAYAAGAVEASRRLEVERHVRACAVCQESIAAWAITVEPAAPEEISAVDAVVRASRDRIVGLVRHEIAAAAIRAVEATVQPRRPPGARVERTPDEG